MILRLWPGEEVVLARDRGDARRTAPRRPARRGRRGPGRSSRDGRSIPLWKTPTHVADDREGQRRHPERRRQEAGRWRGRSRTRRSRRCRARPRRPPRSSRRGSRSGIAPKTRRCGNTVVWSTTSMTTTRKSRMRRIIPSSGRRRAGHEPRSSARTAGQPRPSRCSGHRSTFTNDEPVEVDERLQRRRRARGRRCAGRSTRPCATGMSGGIRRVLRRRP